MFWLVGLILTLAWGAGAFGSNYAWAHPPLLSASAVVGIAGLVLGRARPATSVAATLALLMVAVALQLVPLSQAQLAEWSPRAIDVIRQRSFALDLGEGFSHPLSIDPRQTLLGLGFLGIFSVLLLGTARMLTRDLARRLAVAIMILGVTLSAVGIIQQATFNGKIYGFFELVQGGAPFGPFVNRNHFAGWMLMGIPVALGYFLAMVSRGMEGRRPGFRNLVLWFSTEQASLVTLSGFAILVMTLSLVLTLSRSGITALAIAVMIAGTVIAQRQPEKPRRVLAIGYLAFLVISVVSWVGIDKISARFGQVDLTSISERPAIWADTIRIVKDFWLTGAGLNTYGVSTLFYQTSMPGFHLREAHNDYLQLAAEGGLLLGIPIVVTIVFFAREVRRRLRQDVGSIWWVRMGAVTGLIAIALQSSVEFSLQMPGNAALFAVVAGLAIHDGRRA